MRSLEIGGTPRQTGESYGEQVRNEIGQYYAWRLERNKSLGLSPKTVNGFCGILQQCYPDILEELRGIARGANMKFEQILCLNQADTSDGDDKCTPIALKNSPEGPIVAKNSDLPPEEIGHVNYLIRKCTPKDGMGFVQVVQPGSITGHNMINQAGLAVTSGSVGSVFKVPPMSLDLRLRLYALMRTCRNIDELIAGLQSSPLAGKGVSMAAGDADGNTAIIEAAVPYLAVRDRNKPFIYSTNLFKAKGFESADKRPPHKRPICEYRYGYLRWVEENSQPQNFDDIKNLLASHEPWAPCRHGGSHGSITAYSMISLPQQGKTFIADGAPCENDYKEYVL